MKHIRLALIVLGVLGGVLALLGGLYLRSQGALSGAAAQPVAPTAHQTPVGETGP